MKFFLLGLAIGFLLLFLFISFLLAQKRSSLSPSTTRSISNRGWDVTPVIEYYKTQTFSGMPDIAVCLECHKEPVTQSPEEEKIRQFAKRGEAIPWKQIYHEPDHVFYSHRRHVVLGKIECQTCHGEIGQSEKPPTTPFVRDDHGLVYELPYQEESDE